MSTAPALTWEMTNLRNPATPTSPQDVLDTLALSVGDSTTWTVHSSAAGYIELAPAGGSATPNLRVLIAFGVNAAQIAAPHNLAADTIYVGIAPDGGTLGNPLGAANPYGVARWSGYWKCSASIPVIPISSCFVLCADEVVSIWFYDGASDGWRGAITGAFIDPPADSDGEGTPGRVYGMAVSGSDVLNQTFWQTATAFLSSASSSSGPVTGCFHPPTPTVWQKLDRMQLTSANPPRLETAGGSRMSFPWFSFQESAPNNLLGVYRQMRISTDSRMRTVIQDSGLTDRSFHVGGRSNVDCDVVSFDNG